MHPKEIGTSEEYRQALPDFMLEWAKSKKSLTIPQLLEEIGIGYSYFKYLCDCYPPIDVAFEMIKNTLFNRWLAMGLKEDKLPPHKMKLIARYIRLYDLDGLDTEDKSKATIAREAVKAELDYVREEYESESLPEPYNTMYQRNLNKVGGPAASE